MKLPVLATLADAWREAIHDRRLLLRLAGMPLALSILGGALLVLGQPAPDPETGQAASLERNLRTFLYVLASAALVLPVITAWHRHVILGPSAVGTAAYRLGAAEWMYVRKSLFAAVLLLLPFMVVGFVVSFGVQDERGRAVLTSIGNLALGLWICSRPWLLIFPAAALARSLSLAEARRLTQGNRLRLAAILALAYLPQAAAEWLIGAVASALAGPEDPAALRIAAVALETATGYAFLAVTVGALSFSYLRLSAVRGPGA